MNQARILLLSSMLIFILISDNEVNGQSQKNSIHFAGLQMNTTSDIWKNKEQIIDGIRKAAAKDADFLVTPEGSLSGYTSKFNQEEVDKALPEILKLAKELKIGLFLGTCYKEKIKNVSYCYNQVRVYTPTGEYLGAYSKILRCSPLEYPGTGEMSDYVEGVLKVFEWEGIKIGTLICNDLWATPGYTTMSNPYLAWKLKQMGAQTIVHCINSGTDQRYREFHESSAELWAMSLHIPIIEVNTAQGNSMINAGSGLIGADGIRTVVVPDVGEQLFIAETSILQ